MADYPSLLLTGKTVGSSYQNLLQYSGSNLLVAADGNLFHDLNNFLTTSSVIVSASWASQSLSASYAPFTPSDYSISSSWASQSLSASYTETASFSDNFTVNSITFNQQTQSFSSTSSLDFNGKIKTMTLTGSTYFTSSNLSPGKTVVMKLYASGSSYSLFWPTNYIWLNSTASTQLASGKTAVVSLTCFGNTESDVVVAWGSQL